MASKSKITALYDWFKGLTTRSDSGDDTEGKNNTSISPEEHDCIVHAQVNARNVIKGKGSVDQLKAALDPCPFISQAINLRDLDGYNLLQMAIIENHPDVIEYLISQGADINSPVCGRPIHLACRLRSPDILRILLKYGGDPHVIGAVCYPHPHNYDGLSYDDKTQDWGGICINDVYKSQTPDLFNASVSALGTKKTKIQHDTFNYPLYYAIKSDCLECVKILLECESCLLYNDQSPLTVACEHGAWQSTEHFLSQSPDLINLFDFDGYSPLHRAIPYGEDFLRFLMSKGAAITTKSNKGETMLHLLFKIARNFKGMASLCKYLIDCGLKMTINAVDHKGNSALHLCIKRFNVHSPRSERDWKELASCVRLLFDNQANPNIANREDLTPLHVAMDVFDFESLQMDPSDDTEDKLKMIAEKYDMIKWVIDVLLSSNANPNIPIRIHSGKTTRMETPLIIFVHHLLRKAYSANYDNVLVNYDMMVYGKIYKFAREQNLGLDFLAYFRQLAVDVITLMSEHGGLSHPREACQEKRGALFCPVRLVLSHLQYCDEIFGENDDMDFAEDYLISIYSYLKCLLKLRRASFLCLNPDVIKDIASAFLLSNSVMHYEMFYNILVLLLQYGANPNTCTCTDYDGVPSLDYDSHPIVLILCTPTSANYDSSKLTPEVKSQLLGIFVNTMDKLTLLKCFECVQKRPDQPSDFPQIYAQIYSSPPNLRSLSARKISSLLQQQIAQKVDALPLPLSVRGYLLEFQY